MLLTEKSTAEKFILSSDANSSPNQRLLPITATINDQNHLVIGGCDVTWGEAEIRILLAKAIIMVIERNPRRLFST
jgi:hypothetical protein